MKTRWGGQSLCLSKTRCLHFSSMTSLNFGECLARKLIHCETDLPYVRYILKA